MISPRGSSENLGHLCTLCLPSSLFSEKGIGPRRSPTPKVGLFLPLKQINKQTTQIRMERIKNIYRVERPEVKRCSANGGGVCGWKGSPPPPRRTSITSGVGGGAIRGPKPPEPKEQKRRPAVSPIEGMTARGAAASGRPLAGRGHEESAAWKAETGVGPRGPTRPPLRPGLPVPPPGSAPAPCRPGVRSPAPSHSRRP